jgi:hypothetical protein
MPYVGGSLRSLFDKKQQLATKDSMAEMATKAAEFWVEATSERTPVATGVLKGSWYKLPTKWVGSKVESGIASNIGYAPHVEYGTGLYGPKAAKYPILPKKPGGFLRWIDPKTGKEVFARKVMHPGSPGAYMVSNGGSRLSAATGTGLFDASLAYWESKIVRNAD